MSAKYYYLVSSLSFLRFGQASFLSREDFLSECKKWLSENDLHIISAALLDDFQINSKDIDFLRDWKSFNLILRSQLSAVRRQDSSKARISQLVKTIFEQPDPLSMEKELERIRWNYLEERESSFYFDLNFLLCYFLKLQVLARLNTFNKEEGKKKFEHLCSSVV